MKTVRTFDNLAEAGFASSLLEAAGIHALLAEKQTFAIGYGVGVGGLRLQVEDADWERAMQVLERGPDVAAVATGDKSGLPAREEEPTSREPGRIPIDLFVGAAVFLVLFVLAARSAISDIRQAIRPDAQPDEQSYDYDYNHDGKPDHFSLYRGNQLLRTTTDRNFDGSVDEWMTFDSEGRPERSEVDRNLDGRPDAWFVYWNGVPETSRRDTDFNGQVDWNETYENGLLVRSDCRPNESGVIVRREVYTNEMLHEEWVDENRDGTFDYKIRYDPFGTPSERMPIELGR